LARCLLPQAPASELLPPWLWVDRGLSHLPLATVLEAALSLLPIVPPVSLVVWVCSPGLGLPLGLQAWGAGPSLLTLS